jgi:nucleoid-associated protein YgaU
MAIDLGKQVGPLPLGAWVAAIGGGLGIALYARNRNSGNNEPIYADDTSSVPGVGTGGLDAVGGDYGNGQQTTGPPTIQSNAQWGQQAFNFLVATGQDGSMSDTAVRNYLAGKPLTLAQNAMISLCLAKLGQPPEPLPDAPTLPPPPVKQAPPVAKPTPTPTPTPAVPKPAAPAPVANVAPPPPRPRTYTVVRGDSLWKIAAKFYGNGSRWPDIFNANRGQIKNANLIYPGQVFVIP